MGRPEIEIGDEAQYRRPEWRAGHNVVLADGQAWALPLPLMRFAPAPNDLGFEVVLRLSGSDRFEALLERFEAETKGPAHIAAALALGREVLLANYDLDAGQVAALLQFSWEESDPEGMRIRDEVLAVALGRGDSLPKP